MEIFELKGTITKMKNLMDAFSNRSNLFKTVQKRKKDLKKTEERMKDVSYSEKKSSVCEIIKKEPPPHFSIACLSYPC